MGKSLKQLLIEITLFISMVALVGHVTVNFWERYIVQDKLAGIRSSLDHLKVTVQNMGYTYDELQQGLIDLTRFNTKSSIPSRETSKEESCKRRRELDDKILNHLDVLLTRDNDKPRHVLVVDKNTGSTAVSTKAQARNATTTTRNPLKSAAVGSEPVCINSFKACHNDNECIHKCVLRNSARRCYDDCTSRKRFQKF